MIPSSSNNQNTSGQQPPGLKTCFKTPEGKYKLTYQKSHPAAFLHYTSHAKSVTQVTLARLKDKPTPSSVSSNVSSGLRSAAAKLLGGSKGLSGTTKVGLSCTSNTNGHTNNKDFDGKGTYLVFNVGDAIFISDLSSHDKDPIKSIQFSTSNPISHAFDPDAKDGHDLLIGLNSGDVYLASLRLQLHDVGKKLVGAHHYNKDGCVNNSRCTSIAWLPNGDGTFVVAHADGNIYVYEKSKDGSSDPSFHVIKDQTQFSVSHARKNPIARWHICQGSINSIAFSNDGVYIATVGRDGYLRVFDFKSEQLICGGKSYYGALLCCSWSMDGKYVLTGGEDDLVQVWSMEERKIVAWGEGHSSWVSGVAFDSHWSTPNTDGTGENVVYRFGSVGQDTQLLLWELEMNEIVLPLRRATGGSPTKSSGNQSAHRNNAASPVGNLQPSPSMRDVPMISPLVVHRVETEPLSGLIFTNESILTACREGHIKVWTRPTSSETQDSVSEKPLKFSNDRQ